VALPSTIQVPAARDEDRSVRARLDIATNAELMTARTSVKSSTRL